MAWQTSRPRSRKTIHRRARGVQTSRFRWVSLPEFGRFGSPDSTVLGIEIPLKPAGSVVGLHLRGCLG